MMYDDVQPRPLIARQNLIDIKPASREQRGRGQESEKNG
jgi:hypothetical protein